jgi:hypothetical protein
MSMRTFHFSLLFLFLAGCHHLQDYERPTPLPDGTTVYVARCNGDAITDCYRDMGDGCTRIPPRQHYQILEIRQGSVKIQTRCLGLAVGVVLAGCDTGPSTGDYEIFYDCKGNAGTGDR